MPTKFILFAFDLRHKVFMAVGARTVRMTEIWVLHEKTRSLLFGLEKATLKGLLNAKRQPETRV